MKPLGVTRCLALAGVADYEWSNDEAAWRGSEVHRACELLDRGTLNRKTLLPELRGYVAAYERFKRECHFIPSQVEIPCRSRQLSLRGRADRLGLFRGKRSIGDIKTGAVRPATALQLVLYGRMIAPASWVMRWAVQLKPEGRYSVRVWDVRDWATDLATALACVRVAQWRLANEPSLR